MELLGVDGTTESASFPGARPISRWPAVAVIVVSGVALILAAVLRAFIPALITYAAVLVIGCGLLFYQRWLAIAATRQAGGVGYVSMSAIDRLALVCVTLACLANGLVIAFEVASWGWGI